MVVKDKNIYFTPPFKTSPIAYLLFTQFKRSSRKYEYIFRGIAEYYSDPLEEIPEGNTKTLLSEKTVDGLTDPWRFFSGSINADGITSDDLLSSRSKKLGSAKEYARAFDTLMQFNASGPRLTAEPGAILENDD